MTSIRVGGALLAVALAASGCGFLPDDVGVPGETRAAADELEKELAAVEGVADAEVDVQHEGDGYDLVLSTVTLLDDASEERLAAVIEVVPDLVADSGLADVQAVSVVLDDGASVSVGVGPKADPADPPATARLLFRLVDVVGDRATVRVAAPLAADLSMDDASAADLSELLHEALDDPVLSAQDVSWWATAFSGEEDQPAWDWSGDLSAGPGRLATTLTAYDGLLASYDAAPDGVSLLRVKASGGRGGVMLENVMEIEPAVADVDLTPVAWGSRMGPLLSAQAAVVDDLPNGSMLTVENDGGSFDAQPFLIYPGPSYNPASGDWVEFITGG